MRFIAVAAALVLAAGCAQPFTRPALDELKFGETTPDQVIQRIGREPGRSTIERGGRTYEVISYVMSNDMETPHGYDGIIPARSLVFVFDQGRLVGYEFNSTAASDHTDFSARNVKELVKGRTTRAEVTELFGKPSGVFAYPLAETQGGAMIFGYRELRRVPFGKPNSYSKSLIIYFDANGTVYDYTYTTSGTP